MKEVLEEIGLAMASKPQPAAVAAEISLRTNECGTDDLFAVINFLLNSMLNNLDTEEYEKVIRSAGRDIAGYVDITRRADAARQAVEAGEEIVVLIVAPNEPPRKLSMPNTIGAIQEIIDGNMEVSLPYSEEVVIICNEEHRFPDLPFNREIRNEAGVVVDVINGTFIVAAMAGSELTGLSDEQVERYIKMFEQ